MTHHKHDNVHDNDENVVRETPSQAEGERDTANAELKGKKDKPDHDLLRETPSQAEGSEETVDEILAES